MKLSEMSREEQKKWDKKYMRFWRKRTKRIAEITFQLRETVREEFMSKYKLER